jgi:hypothetical protein
MDPPRLPQAVAIHKHGEYARLATVKQFFTSIMLGRFKKAPVMPKLQGKL